MKISSANSEQVICQTVCQQLVHLFVAGDTCSWLNMAALASKE